MTPTALRVVKKIQKVEEMLVALYVAMERGDTGIAEMLCKQIACDLGKAKIEAEDL